MHRIILPLFTFLTTSLVLVAVEVAFRVLPVDISLLVGNNGRDDPGGCFVPSVTRGWAPRPGACGYGLGGFKAPEPAGARAPGEARLLLLGDSIGAMPGWVEATAEALGDGLGRRVSIYNASVYGYNTCQELTALREVGDGVDVDAILLQTCTNDISGSPVLTPAGPGRLRFHLDGLAFDFPAWVLRSRALTYLTLRWGLSRYAREQRGRPAEATMRTCLRGVQALAQEQGRPLLALSFPVLMELDGVITRAAQDAREMERTVAGHVAEVGVPTLDLRPALSEGGDIARWRGGPGDVLHPQPESHPVIAAAAARFILDSGVLGGAVQ